ncbi:MAG: iron-sulfur cluster repair di-iron protein [Isosphaeraceae bacterium]
MSITPETPVGVAVAERLGRARVFDRLGIDYCCGGMTPLAEACGLRSLDVARVLAEIADCDARDAVDDGEIDDYAAIPLGELADHIVATHHAYLRRELPRLSGLIEKVLAAHGERHAELEDLRDTFAGLRQELESHLMKEERVLFPMVTQLEATGASPPGYPASLECPLRVMLHEHETAGAALERIVMLTGNFTTPADGCATFRALYEGLADFGADLRRHIHKENNILFPRAAALESSSGRAAYPPADPLREEGLR